MRTKVLLFLVLMLLLTAGVAWAAPGGGIKGTNHDFTPTGPEFTTDVGLCTFCHTPHKAGTQRLIWNHELPNQSYTWGDTTHTIGGTQLPTIDTSWTGPTRYCLSCHDGSVAFGSVYWFDKKAWLGANKMNVGAEDDMTHHTNHLIGFGGNLGGNHPVAAPYPYQQAKNTYNSQTTGNEVILGEFVADPGANKIRLFNNPSGSQVVAGAVAGKTGIECSSCHDPHNSSTVEDKYFIRGKLKGSDLASGYICLKCHTK